MNRDIYVIIEHLQGQVAEISYVMLAAAQALVENLAGSTGSDTTGQVVAVLLGHDAQELAADLGADKVLYANHPALADFTSEAYQRVLASLIQDNLPRLVLFGDTSIGADVAGSLSGRLGLPLVSYCRRVWAEGDTLKFVSQICGGKIIAEGDLPGPTVLVTMIPGAFKSEQGRSAQPPEVVPLLVLDLTGLRMTLKQYIEPDTSDVDISKEPVLVAVGRGIQNKDNLELVQELAEALGGVVCASRPVVDQDWLPTTRLVGKSGKRVKPHVYLAMGISGAPEHVEAITDSELVIAVNTDSAAPIFDMAQYGAEVDILDLLPVLTEKVKQAKDG
jgi:electron transfer flavoprotein alpha subunit